MKKSSKRTAPKKNKAALKKVEQPEIVVPAPPVPEVPANPIVNVKCRRGSDKISEGQSCSSLTAENLTLHGSTIARFRCTKCKFSWGIPTGGTFQV